MSEIDERGYFKTVNGKLYGPYYYKRRTHYWTSKDLARVAKHLKEQDKVDAKEILIAVAFAVGMGAIFCKAAKAINSGLSIMSFIEKLSVVLGTGLLIQTLIEFLLQVKLVAPRWLYIILALAIALLSWIEKLLKAFNEFAQDRDVIMEGARVINELCDAAKEYAGIAIEETCDATNANVCYWAERKAEELANELKPEIDNAWNELVGKSWFDRLIQLIQDHLHDGEWLSIP